MNAQTSFFIVCCGMRSVEVNGSFVVGEVREPVSSGSWSDARRSRAANQLSVVARVGESKRTSDERTYGRARLNAENPSRSREFDTALAYSHKGC